MLRIGIDLGGTKTEGVVIDERGTVLSRQRRPTPVADGYDAILTNIAALVAELEQIAGRRCRVGIGTPGALSTRTGRLKNSNTTCLNGRSILQDIEHRLARPIKIANDANCFTLSEARDGAGRDAPIVFGVILGTGVGGGIVAHGRLIAGHHHIAGEWGHNVLEGDGPACYCGKRGCVETFLSGPGLVREYRASGGGDAAPADIVTRAGSGEKTAASVLERYMDRFGRAMSVVVNILDPDVIVLGGGLSNIDALYTVGRAQLARYVFAAHGARPEPIDSDLSTPIRRNHHGDSSGVRGAAQLWEPGDDEK